MSEKIATREAYGKALVELGAANEQVVVLDADLAGATMTKHFKAAYPQRFFDCGIAEADMMNIAAGLSTMGLVPFCSTFAMFGAGRAYEQIRNSIAYPKFNVKICCSHAGVSVGEDGGSHQAIEDIGLMRLIPGMTVIVPADAKRPGRPPWPWRSSGVRPICVWPVWPPPCSRRIIPLRSARPTSCGRAPTPPCLPAA